MTRIVRLFVAFLFVVFMGCNVNAENLEKEDYEVYVNQIVKEFAQVMKEDLGLRCIGEGGRMPYDVETIAVDFISYQNASIDQARLLEVKATEKLLQIVNNHEKIRPYLREFPFKFNRADVSIAFRKTDNSRYTDRSVTLVYQAKNKIYYRRYNPLSDQLQPLAEEPYEEALIKVGKSTQK